MSSKHKKKILIYAHYYYPDVASTGQILTELAEGMSDVFDVTVICVVPSYTGKVADKYKTRKYYSENINGVRVVRIRVPEFKKDNKRSRIINILSYFFNAILVTKKVGRADYVYAISQPPVLGGLLGVWGKKRKKAKFIYNIQDFNPEQTMAVDYSKNKLLLSFMMRLDKYSCKKADKVIVVGRDMVKTLEKRFDGQKMPEYACINNWINEGETCPLARDDSRVVEFKKRYGLEDKFVIMYSGNIGLYYDLENLMSVIRKFSEQNNRTKDGREVAFAFVGEGSMLEELKKYKQKNNLESVVFIPYQDKKDLVYSLNAGDVHWVVNAKGIKGVSVPSKCYGVMAVGKPVLGVLEQGSEARMIIEHTGCGLCCEPCDYDSVLENIRWFVDNADSEMVLEMGRCGREYLVKNLTRDISIQKYIDEILNC